MLSLIWHVVKAALCTGSRTWKVRTGRPHRSRTSVWKDIQQWIRAKQLDAAIWTDLPPKFDGDFTLESAIAFWKRLPPDKAEEARNYANDAPEEVDTDLRRRLQAENLLGAPAGTESSTS